MNRIGVFVCHCGMNILGNVDVERVVEAIRVQPGVAHAEARQDMCLDGDKASIVELVRSNQLDGLVFTSCSSSLHAPTFVDITRKAELSRECCQVADLKEVSGWPHNYDVDTATHQAIQAIESSIERLKESRPVSPIDIPIVKKALVIGGGAAGIQASLDIADGGYEVILVEKSSTIGGHMLKLSECFPTLDCPQCIMTPKMVELNQHPNIKLLACSEVDSVSGQVGDFKVRVRRKATYVDEDKCTGCLECTQVCPVEIKSWWDHDIALQKAIYKPFAQAVPNMVTIQKKGMPFCRATCPLHCNGQAYVALIAQGRFDEALKVVRETLPFPKIMGRICAHPCESACKRGEVDEPISICSLKRFIADREEEPQIDLTISEEREEKVAIVGSGPAGLLAAYDLRKKGYKVTIFEALPHLGGMLRVGIPEYRLPKDILDEEISIIQKLGVDIQLNSPIGKAITIEDLQREYKAVFLAIGNHVSARLPIPGADLDGVIGALPFLKASSLGEKPEVKGKILVIGGGNVAIDAARTAWRLGATEVHLACLESRQEMPAFEWEVEGAEKEGVIIHNSLAPQQFNGNSDQRVSGVDFKRVTSIEFDSEGRIHWTLMEGPGSDYSLAADTVIVAIGQRADFDLLGELGDIRISRRGTIEVDAVTLQTNVEGVFAGGDAVTGPASVVEALAAGRKAAISIDRYIKGEDLNIGREGEGTQKTAIEVDTRGVEKKPRAKTPALLLSERASNFEEVELGLTEEQAIEEAKRCLSCADCCECMSCVRACEREAIDHTMTDRFEDYEVGAIVMATGYDLYPKENIPEYQLDPDIIDGLQFERILCPSGPTDGVVKRPSDGKEPKEVVLVSCVGSRDPEHGVPYCSRVCCMYNAKMAMLYKHAVPDGQAYIFYIDIRVTGKGYEEFVQRAVEEDKVLYLRGRVSKIFREGDKVRVWGVDTLTGKKVELSADLVVLATAMVPRVGTKELCQRLNLETDEFGFITESHFKMRPTESTVPGIFLAGTAQGPKDITDSVVHASGAAAGVLSLFSEDSLLYDAQSGEIVEAVLAEVSR